MDINNRIVWDWGDLPHENRPVFDDSLFVHLFNFVNGYQSFFIDHTNWNTTYSVFIICTHLVVRNSPVLKTDVTVYWRILH